ncbi:mechanosensitive ion channel family protein [Castellaniella ginsengisoli]|uniref:Mechanosensitive ion channel family protein n=1 Tax=Castellaniella ginsengisoli TaxID=546114 RepID=A0AB39CHR8_9BURK
MVLAELSARYGDIWGAWFAALILATLIYLGLSSLLKALQRRASFPPGETETHRTFFRSMLSIMARSNRVILASLALLIAAHASGALLPWRDWVGAHVWFALVTIQVALWLDAACLTFLSAAGADSQTGRVTTFLLAYLLRTVIWILAILAVLDNLGVHITTLVASLGIGGVAVALAAQAILSDLFASIAIGLDKPFEPGDFIVFGNMAGSIEHIGLKTTRIRSLGGEQIICSNAELLKQTIQNYKRMEQRRVVFTLHLPYGTPACTLADLPGDVEAQIKAQSDARYDRAHIARLGDWALELEAVYYVTDADYNQYMDIQQAINLGILKALEARGITLSPMERTIRLRPDPAIGPPAS